MGYVVLLGLVLLAWLVWKKLKDRATEKRLADRTAELIKSGVLQPLHAQPVVDAAPDDDHPFGIDIDNPDARDMPVAFQSSWAHPTARRGEYRMTIEPRRLVFPEGSEQVVAVMFGATDQISVVTRTQDETYALRYLGLRDEGRELVDLENMDWVLNRC